MLATSCVDVASSFQLPITNIPTSTELAPFELTNAHDEIDDGCAPPGARDVLLELTTPIEQTFVFDTGGATTMDVALSLHDGSCPGTASRLACASSTTVPPTNMCATPNYNDLVVTLPGPHTYCLVVSETQPGAQGTVALRVFAAGTAASFLDPIGPPVAEDACMGAVAPAFDCVSPAGDRAVAASVIMLCPGKTRLLATIAPDPTLTAAVTTHALLPNGPSPQCNVGAGPGSAMMLDEPDLPGPLPYWFLVQRATSSCGSFHIQATEQ